MTKKRVKSGVVRTQEQNLIPTATAEVTTTADTAFSFTEDQYTDENGTEAFKCKIRVVTNNAIYAYGVDPLTLSNAYPLDADNEFILEHPDEIKSFQLANSTGAQQVTFIYTMFFPN